jgi:hypothetical protein
MQARTATGIPQISRLEGSHRQRESEAWARKEDIGQICNGGFERTRPKVDHGQEHTQDCRDFSTESRSLFYRPFIMGSQKPGDIWEARIETDEDTKWMCEVTFDIMKTVDHAFSKARISRSTLVKYMGCAAREQGMESNVGFEVLDRVKLAVGRAAKEKERVGRTISLRQGNERDRSEILMGRVVVLLELICILSFLSCAAGLGSSL